MKKFLIIVLIPVLINAMDRPARVEQPKSPFVELVTDFFSSPKVPELFNKGPQISSQELMQLVELAKKGYFYFWDAHGINFLLKVTLVQESKTESGKKLSEQARESLSKAYNTQIKELLGIAKKESKASPLLTKIDEGSVKKLWKELLDLTNPPSGLEIIRDIRQNYEDEDKKEPAIINFMIDELVNKICGNVLVITDYLKKNKELDELVQPLRKHYAFEVKALTQIGSDTKVMQDNLRILIGMLTANKLSCPIFVKEKVLELTKPTKGLLSTVKGIFTP